MKQKQLVSLLENKSIVVPLLFFKEYKKLDISLEEFMFLMYLYHLGDKSLFNPTKYAIDLTIDSSQIMEFIDTLNSTIKTLSSPIITAKSSLCFKKSIVSLSTPSSLLNFM